MRADVLINTKPGKVRDILAAVAQLEHVRHADACWGMPDIFVEAQTADRRGLTSSSLIGFRSWTAWSGPRLIL